MWEGTMNTDGSADAAAYRPRMSMGGWRGDRLCLCWCWWEQHEAHAWYWRYKGSIGGQ